MCFPDVHIHRITPHLLGKIHLATTNSPGSSIIRSECSITLLILGITALAAMAAGAASGATTASLLTQPIADHQKEMVKLIQDHDDSLQ